MATKNQFEELNKAVTESLVEEQSSSTEPVTVTPKHKLPGNLRNETRKLYNRYLDEDRIEVVIAPMYADYFGSVMTTTINNISVRVPCNGEKVKVPESFAAEINRRITLINEKLTREKRLNQHAVFENTPGDAQLF